MTTPARRPRSDRILEGNGEQGGDDAPANYDAGAHHRSEDSGDAAVGLLLHAVNASSGLLLHPFHPVRVFGL